ncbi:NUDIX domain-containing protein [Chitinophaga pendula]|uniref:NUDIX domain-containing protein n=1 Tax=Chitinophaga TaxID=79328 RepID=UPI000BAF32FF|nr:MULTISPECIES: NUDIX domain-containing protein [Chitinophaga]ASZ13485.1 NUDIX hydrolase [Chitinophaga sp. MD30]UCJ08885.1 NUDIX domain-containing protein [Chitinophaga pendula]
MKRSAGLLPYRQHYGELQYFLVHPGGPFFARKEAGWWTIVKGEYLVAEDPLAAAIREFEEETGYVLKGQFIALTPILQKGGKHITCWAIESSPDADNIRSNTFTIEWPPRSGRQQSFPEIDKAGWFNKSTARRLINERQIALLEELERLLKI